MTTRTPDRIRELLVLVREERHPFSVVFSGEKSKRVNGYYTVGTFEITINDLNFSDDQNLLFTALHEYAHHISMTELGVSSAKAHSPAFWTTFYGLLDRAAELGLYDYPFRGEEFRDVTMELEDLIERSGEITVEIGRALTRARNVCEKANARFDDYVLRELRQSVPWSKDCIRAYCTDAPASLGPEGQKVLAGIKNPYTRKRVERGLLSGMSLAQARMAASGKPRASGLNRSETLAEISALRKKIEELEGTL